MYAVTTGPLPRIVAGVVTFNRLGLLQKLVERLPRDRGVARQEIERLALYLGPGSGAQGDAALLDPSFGVEPGASLCEGLPAHAAPRQSAMAVIATTVIRVARLSCRTGSSLVVGWALAMSRAA